MMAAPHQPSRQRLKWRAEALGYALLSALLRMLPVDVASGLGGGLMRRLGLLSSRHALVHRNLRIAFPEMETAERERIARAQWDNFGRYLTEMFFMDRLTPATGRVEIVGGERLREFAQSSAPAVFISAHLSNMEIMSSAILAAGIDCVITGRALNNPYINARLLQNRRRYGLVHFAPKGARGARDQLLALKEGKSVAHMVDQKNNQGVTVAFFGHPAATESSAAKLAIKFGALLVPLSVQRTTGARFRVTVHDPITIARTGERQDDVLQTVRAINRFVEERVRERPDEWWWSHKRWPQEVYAHFE